jgi:hypothetical protein
VYVTYKQPSRKDSTDYQVKYAGLPRPHRVAATAGILLGNAFASAFFYAYRNGSQAAAK